MYKQQIYAQLVSSWTKNIMIHLALLGMSKFLTNQMLYRMRMSLSLCQVQLTFRKTHHPYLLLLCLTSHGSHAIHHVLIQWKIDRGAKRKLTTAGKQDSAGYFGMKQNLRFSNFVIFL